MTDAVLINLEVNLQQRITELATEYGSLDRNFLVECTERIGKRLGPLQTMQAVVAIRENRIEDFIRLVLVYYDKTYRNGLAKRRADQLFSIALTHDAKAENAIEILDFINTIPAHRQA